MAGLTSTKRLPITRVNPSSSLVSTEWLWSHSQSVNGALWLDDVLETKWDKVEFKSVQGDSSKRKVHNNAMG